jgi:hypothetical protein
VIRHVVSWKLKATDESAKAAAFTEMAEALGALPAKLPIIKSFHIGRDLLQNDGNWDVVLIVDYATPADLAAYQVHPEHVAAAAVVREHVTERAVVDFEF